jgi:hypothetical protein
VAFVVDFATFGTETIQIGIAQFLSSEGLDKLFVAYVSFCHT